MAREIETMNIHLSSSSRMTLCVSRVSFKVGGGARLTMRGWCRPNSDSPRTSRHGVEIDLRSNCKDWLRSSEQESA
jgi:hypothetical protein